MSNGKENVIFCGTEQNKQNIKIQAIEVISGIVW